MEDIEPDHYYGGGKIPCFQAGECATRSACMKFVEILRIIKKQTDGVLRPWTNLETFRPLSRGSTNTECRQEL